MQFKYDEIEIASDYIDPKSWNRDFTPDVCGTNK